MRLRWVYTDQPFLPITQECAILNRIWTSDDDDEFLVGQLPFEDSDFVQDARWKLPAGLKGDHMCHPEWFSTGEPWPNDLPPATYNVSGIPTCCGLLQDVTAGGLAIGGSCGDKWTAGASVSGGLAIGGQVVENYTGVDAARGGVGFGQFVGDLYRNSDATAGGLAIGQSVGDLYGTSDATVGGLAIGGTVGDVPSFADATAGGLAIGGANGDQYTQPTATTGGLAIGGSCGDKLTGTDATTGGLAIGGSCGDNYSAPTPTFATSGHSGVINVALPTNTSGTGLLVMTLTTDGPNPTDPSGWTRRAAIADGSGTSFMVTWTRVANGASSVTVSAPGTTSWGAVAGYYPNRSGLDGTASTNSGTGTTATAPSKTAAGAGEYRVCSFAANGAATETFSLPGTLTGSVTNGVCATGQGYRIVSAGSTGTDTTTIPGGGWAADVILLT